MAENTPLSTDVPEPAASHEGQLMAVAPPADGLPSDGRTAPTAVAENTTTAEAVAAGVPAERSAAQNLTGEGETRQAGEQGGLLSGRATRAMPSASSVSLSPAQLTWRQLRKNKFAVSGGLVLLLLYTLALFARFIAPYDAETQSPGGFGNTSYHPPMKLRWREANGRWHLRPFVYATVKTRNEFLEEIHLPDPNRPVPLHFFVRGAPYRLFGIIPTDVHLFGVPQGAGVFLLGTDEAGRDYFSRLLVGSQISLSVGLLAIAISFSLGMLVGGISGFYGGRMDSIIMRVCEVIMSVPDFYLLLALAAALPDNLDPVTVYLLITAILALVGWAGMARVIRGMVLSVREREYVEAARALGASDLKIIVRHILPATFTYAIVAATMSVPGYILAEAGLSFLGLGIRDPVPSWGNMLTAAQNLSTLEERRWILAPGFMIFITTLAFNFLGDGLRDALDPKSRRLG